MVFHRARSWLPLAGAAALAFILRLAYQAELMGSPLVAGLMGDSRQYDAWAQQIAGGQWMGAGVFYQTPLYPYALAALFRIAGHDLDLVRLVQAALGAASCVLVGLAGRRFFSNRVGIVAALLLAVSPAAIFFDGLVQKSSLDIFLVAVMLLVMAEIGARRNWKWIVALGLVASLFALNRENARVLYPVFGAWLWLGFRDAPRARRAGWIAAFAAASSLVILPVGLRNYRAGGEFVISTSQLGPNFYIGNNAQASGTYEPLVPGRGDPVFEREDATRLASQAAGRTLSPAEVSDFWLRRALAFIRTHPAQWLALVAKKILLTLNAAELSDTESIEAYADYSRILRALLWLDLGLFLPLAALGAWIHRSEWRRLVILYGMFAALGLAVAIFYVLARYRHPVLPIVLLFAAAGLTAAVDALRQRSSWRVNQRQWLPGLAIALLAALVAHIPFHVARDETYLNLGTLLAQKGRPADAIPVLQKAASLDRDDPEPHFRLGLAYQDAGQPEPAIDELKTSLRLRPENSEAHSALGLLLKSEDRPADALVQFREAVVDAPDSPDAHSNLGLALMETGHAGDAIAEHRRALALGPATAGRHNNLALALAAAGDVNGAIEEFDEAIRLKPDDYELRANLATALCEAARTAEGIEQYEIAERLATDAGRPDIAQSISEAVHQLPQRRFKF